MSAAIRSIAPAKINLTLEILDRRDDGYHEIRSVMQTVDIVDDLTLTQAPELSLEVEGPHVSSGDDLVLQAARATADHIGFTPRGSFRLAKRIPAAAGLGGGSSDAAAAIRLLHLSLGLKLPLSAQVDIAASVSSDAPFFCYGGTAFVEGRGEVVEPLPDAIPFWVVIVTPPMSIPEKTARMYRSIEPGDFSDGAASGRVADLARTAEPITNDDIVNCFDRAAYEVFDGLGEVRSAILNAGADAVHVAGSGPALFTLAPTEDDAREIAGRIDSLDCRVDVARTLTARQATLVDGLEN
jgi:4-diphosphocytidyl-2-C-methyl-D-erythritol kinase